jgi:hypothetical protein
MAATAAGQQLTEQHRQGQLRIRAQALQSYTQLWPTWEGDEDSFLKLVLAATVLVRTYRGFSSAYAGSYFQSYRMAEGAPGEAVTMLADPVDEAAVRTGMYVTGQTAVRNALKAGRPPEEAKSSAFTGTSGSISRHVLNGGRETILRSVDGDKAALGWGRVTDGDPCAFCALLASRGPVYKEEGTADFQAHDHDGCTVEPVYTRGAEWPGRSREFHDLYNEAIHEANEADELDRGTSNDLFNAFRRKYEAQRHQPSRSS